MKTLYDLLGALPDDDAEGLRTAFRNAARAAHPDVNSDDPDASLRFRQIIRANAILSDAQQRAAYDRLLALTLRQPPLQPPSKSRRAIIFGKVRKVIHDAAVVAFFSAVSIGGYVLFEHLSKPSAVPLGAIEMTGRGSVEIAAVTPLWQLDTIGMAGRDDRDGPRGKPEQRMGKPEQRMGMADEATAIEMTAPSAVGSVAKSGHVEADTGPAPYAAANDANSYRQRGSAAYRDGELHRAIANFDQAIQLDPTVADVYIDRAIAFYRLQQFDRAFADIAEAKRIGNARRTTPDLQAARKTSPSTAKD